jgi:hypothetical protein
MDHRGFMRGKVVADHVDHQAGFGLTVDLVQKVAEVDGPVLGGQLADHLAGGRVQGREQIHRAVPHVVETAPLRRPGQHRQHRGGALQGLDLRFLIDREDDRVRRRRQVEPHDVADLVDQQRIRGDLEGLGPPGLEPERPPDPQHAGRRDPRLPGQFALGPVRGAFRNFFQGAHHHLLDLGVGDGTRHSRTRVVGEPVEPVPQETRPPPDDRLEVDAQPRCDGRVATAVSAGQHDPRPQRQPLRGAPAPDPVL